MRFLSVLVVICFAGAVLAGCLGGPQEPSSNVDVAALSPVMDFGRDRFFVLAGDGVDIRGGLFFQDELDGSLVLSASASGGWQAEAFLVDSSSDARVHEIRLNATPPEAVEVGDNITVLVRASSGGTTLIEHELLVSVADGYELTNFLTWDHAELEIVIVPPAHGPLVSTEDGPLPYGPEGALPGGVYLDATLHVIDDWRWALDRFAENHTDLAWVADINWTIRIISEDLLTPDDVQNADIIKLYTETTYPILGAAVNTGGLLGGETGPGCVAYNTKWITYGSLTYVDMYTLAGHELLHCFGMSHPEGMEPGHDIMSYEDWPIPDLRCPSDLNVLAAAAAFASAFDGVSGPDSGASVKVPQPSYEQYCSPHSDRRE